MNITLFNRDYVMRRYGADGKSYSDQTVSIHLHPMEHGSGTWPEQQGIVRQISGHGNVEIREASLTDGNKADRVYYCGRWYECVSSVYYDRTHLSHWNYSFVEVPEDAMETITLFNAAYNAETGYDVYIPTVITGVSWLEEDTAAVDTQGIRSTKKYTVRIPEDADFSGKAYVEPAGYTGDTSTFTLMNGDIIIRGAEDTITSPTELKKKYRNLMTVLGVYDFRKAPNARHWKVVGE